MSLSQSLKPGYKKPLLSSLKKYLLKKCFNVPSGADKLKKKEKTHTQASEEDEESSSFLLFQVFCHLKSPEVQQRSTKLKVSMKFQLWLQLLISLLSFVSLQKCSSSSRFHKHEVPVPHVSGPPSESRRADRRGQVRFRFSLKGWLKLQLQRKDGLGLIWFWFRGMRVISWRSKQAELIRSHK